MLPQIWLYYFKAATFSLILHPFVVSIWIHSIHLSSCIQYIFFILSMMMNIGFLLKSWLFEQKFYSTITSLFSINLYNYCYNQINRLFFSCFVGLFFFFQINIYLLIFPFFFRKLTVSWKVAANSFDLFVLFCNNFQNGKKKLSMRINQYLVRLIIKSRKRLKLYLFFYNFIIYNIF